MGLDGRTREHSGQEEINCRISLVMPGQKYRPLAKEVVLEMPEWLACRSFKINLMEGRGSTILLASIRMRPSERDRTSK